MRLPCTKTIGPRYGAVRLTPTLHPMKKTAIIADSITDQVHNTSVVISGGECVCHVEKLSVPDEVRFN